MSDQTPVGVPTCYRHPGRETWIRCQRCERPICPDCMRDASVGFQCPSCVSEGAKSTRQHQAAYGGRRPTNPAITSISIIALNAAVWLAIIATGWQSSTLIRRLALVPVGTCETTGGQYYPTVTDSDLCSRATSDGFWVPGVSDGAVWQLITSAFAHVDIWHIGFNMLALWVLGPQLELAIGRARFLALYLVSALAGSTAVYWLASDTGATLGASGAIFGLMGALLVLAHKVGGDVRQILMWLGINVVITVVGASFISWQAHLGGLLGGMAVAAILVYAPRSRRTPVQVAGLSALTLLLVVAIVIRTLTLA